MGPGIGVRRNAHRVHPSAAPVATRSRSAALLATREAASAFPGARSGVVCVAGRGHHVAPFGHCGLGLCGCSGVGDGADAPVDAPRRAWFSAKTDV